MDKLPVNVVDLGVLGVILISTLLAFARGLVREVLSIGAWVVASLVTIYALPHLRDITRAYITQPLVADAVTGVTIFVVTLFVCAAISHMVARNVRASGFGAIDRSLGALFGILRGAILVCLAYLAFQWAEPNPDDQPDIVKNARTLRYVAQGADLLQSLLPKEALDKGAAAAAEIKTQTEQAVTGGLIPGVTPGQPKPAAPAGNSGYKPDDTKSMDQLIKSNQ